MTLKETYDLVQKARKDYRHAMLHGGGQYMENGLYWYLSNTYPAISKNTMEMILEFVDYFGRQSMYREDTVSLQGQHNRLYCASIGYLKCEKVLQVKRPDAGAKMDIREFNSNQYLK